MDRRGFLQASAVTITTVALVDVFGDRVSAAEAQLSARLTTYPRLKICSQDELPINEPYDFEFPEDAPHSAAMIYRLADSADAPRIAGGGVGPQQNIVAFSTICTHMGADMSDGFVSKHSVLSCGEHLTTFNLTRHGIVVAGHATSALPQIVLEIEDDDIFATGILGLLYGYNVNPTA